MDKITKFKDGRELLIEFDAGYISPKDNVKIISEMKELDFTQEIILYAVLQKYNTPNKNGRIYPETLLKREMEKYQILINKGSALNELNHPSCHTGDVDILTTIGWKNIKEIDEFEEIVTLNENKTIEYKTIYSTVKHEYTDKMIHIKGRNIDVSVTPNHKFPIINSNTNELSFITAEEILDSFNNGKNLGSYYIPKTSNVIDNEEIEYFTLKGCPENEFHKRTSQKDKECFSKDLKIPMDIFMSFMGIYLSEGHVGLNGLFQVESISSEGEINYYESSKYGYCVGVSQHKKENIIIIENLLKQLPFKIKKYTNQYGTVSFMINDRRLWKYLKPLGKSYEKHIPTELKNVSPKYLKNLFDWFKIGDGRTIGDYNQSDVFSTSEKLIDDLQELLIKCGLSGNVRKENRKFDRYITDYNGEPRLIKGENSRDMYFLNISKPKGIYLDKRFLKVYEENNTDGFVYSVDVPNHTYYVRSNKKCHWTGNSSLIDLDRVSHSILETWWDNEILMGKIKLFTSPGWRKSGIVSTKGDQAAMLLMNGATLGISSRGVGSLKNINGQNIVQDDFEIVCFDLVSSPSTPGAYIFSDPSERDNYQESIKSTSIMDDRLKKLMGTLDKFNHK
jgi:hypothetical protein